MNKLIFAVLALAAVTVSALPHSCQDPCAVRADGQYNCVSCGECPFSIECRDGQYVSKLCGGYYCNNPLQTQCQKCPTGPDAITSCVGKPDGDYQHCYRCSSFVSCSNGLLYEMPCPHRLNFDVEAKKCLGHSDSCRCPNYQ